ncbi:MAG: hypothetical protein ACK6DS_18295 [Planctomycetota bacterium]|jgi:hypothetical protein
MSKHVEPSQRALVTVFNDLPAAAQAVAALHKDGFTAQQVELVTYSVAEQSPELEMPLRSKTTSSSLVANAEKWGLFGLEAGAVAGVLATITAFPGIILPMLIVGGLTGAYMGGIAGVEQAVLDDRMDLPELDDYEQLLNEGKKLVVVLGTHEEALRAKEVLARTASIQGHMYAIGEHQSHEHPGR